MGRIGLVLVILLATGLGACSPEDEGSTSADVAREPQHPWKEQQKGLKKAEQVEQDMMDAYQHRDEEMEKQTQ